MAGRPVQAGDFVIIEGDRSFDDHAIRSVNINNIVIYPLGDQMNEKTLFQRDGEWAIRDENERLRLTFIGYVPMISLVHGIGPEPPEEAYDVPNNDDYFYFSESNPFEDANVEQLDQAYGDLSEHRITREQFINDLRAKLSGYVDELPPRSFSKNQVEWALKEGIFPPVYNIDHMMMLHDLDLIKRIDQVSTTDYRSYWNIMTSYIDSIRSDEIVSKFLIDLTEYLADKGIAPIDKDLDSVAGHTEFKPFLEIWVDKNLIPDPEALINKAREQDNQEIVDFLISVYQPVKAARKR